jgi:hypothetical protein
MGWYSSLALPCSIPLLNCVEEIFTSMLLQYSKCQYFRQYDTLNINMETPDVQ